MGSTVSYVIIYSIAASMCYTLVILLGFRTALKEHRRSDIYIVAIKQIIKEVKTYIKNKEE